MGEPNEPEDVKLITGMLTNRLKLFDVTRELLVEEFGPVDSESEVLDFNYTDYYEKEFGIGIKRKFISFKNLIRQDALASIKIITNRIEKEFLEISSHNRQINIDPGYISPGKFVLASTKDYQHRIYLGNGIYAELTLRFRKGTFEDLEWTYPDYRAPAYIRVFNQFRRLYMEQRKVLDISKYA